MTSHPSTFVVASRPRTLVLVITSRKIEAVMLGPTGVELGTVRIPRPPDPDLRVAIQSLWPQLEPLGEFDRITVTTRPGLGDTWEPATVTQELERQSFRQVRQVSLAEIHIRRIGVELVIELGAELGSSLYIDGVHVPGLALGRHPFRKGKTYEAYLAPRVLKRKGAEVWTRRLARAAASILEVWNPSMLYLVVPSDVVVELDLPPTVVVVPDRARECLAAGVCR